MPKKPQSYRSPQAWGGQGGGRRTERRPSAAKRGYGRKWRKESKAFLAEHPFCVHCEAEGRTVAATVVDHIKPHRGDPKLFWSRRNWQGLCVMHHNRKTGSGD